MKRIIDGKRYDTETAQRLCSFGYWNGWTDFRSEQTSLHVTKSGRFFLSGEGGPMTRWATTRGDKVAGGEGLMAIDREEARAILEQEDCLKALERWFGAEIEDA
jgi:hypothetical protein